MPKRKRSIEHELEEKLAQHRKELFRMLKVAKGFERQRMAKRLRDPKSTPEKKARIETEVVVLKSLDLQSVANAHLYSSLLKIKAVAEHPKLPDEVKNGVPKPEMSEEERVALHNVTSGLYNQNRVREALDAAIVDICCALRVPMPDKKGKPKKGDKKSEAATRNDPEEQPADRATRPAPTSKDKSAKHRDSEVQAENSSEEEESGQDNDEWNGLSDNGEEDEEAVEKAISRFDDRLGSSDEDESNDEEYDTANEELDPMEITDLSASEESDGGISLGESGSDEKESGDREELEEDESDDESDSSGVSPPRKVSRKDPKRDTLTKAKDTKFLPSLMGGYISGSESEASDIDVAPPARKNRRGQRARQAIWEKKFGDKAKHIGKEKSGRDSGWDLKRGAVDVNERTPWKNGVKTPFEKKPRNSQDEEQGAAEPQRTREPPRKDNEGPLHPSWEAKKKAKEALQTAKFQGKKIVFD